MCLVFAAVEQHPDYPLIIAANRDEFFQRPSEPVHHWPDADIYAGKDLMQGGTWLGVNPLGKFAVVTNYREMDVPTGPLSRGEIPLMWLSNQYTSEAFHQALEEAAERYSGYNCMYGDVTGKGVNLHYVGNRSHTQTSPLPKGLYGLSNGVLDSPWFKVTEGKSAITPLLSRPFSAEDWFAMLADQQTAPEDGLPSTGLDHAHELALSSRFIQLPHYGTRCSSLILVDHQQRMQIIERSFSPDAEQSHLNGATRSLSFHIHDDS